MARQAWDTELARLIARPLARTRVHPNHVTTLHMLLGLAAAQCYATGVPRAASWGAFLFVISSILDHVDGELARMTGTSSASGQAFDRFADLAVRFALFAGMGLGLRASSHGPMAMACGFAAGAAFVTIFALRSATLELGAADALAQPSVGGVDLEDVLYVIAPVTWFGLLLPFVIAAGFGAPLFILWPAFKYRRARADARRRATTASPVRLVSGGRS